MQKRGLVWIDKAGSASRRSINQEWVSEAKEQSLVDWGRIGSCWKTEEDSWGFACCWKQKIAKDWRGTD